MREVNKILAKKKREINKSSKDLTRDIRMISEFVRTCSNGGLYFACRTFVKKVEYIVSN